MFKAQPLLIIQTVRKFSHLCGAYQGFDVYDESDSPGNFIEFSPPEKKDQEFAGLLGEPINEKKGLVRTYIYLYRMYKDNGRSEDTLDLLGKGI